MSPKKDIRDHFTQPRSTRNNKRKTVVEIDDSDDDVEAVSQYVFRINYNKWAN